MDGSEQVVDEPIPSAAEGQVPDDSAATMEAPAGSPHAARSPIRVHVIDDELDGLTLTHLTSSSTIAEVLADLSSPEVEELWSIIVSLTTRFNPLNEEDPETVRQYLSSDAFVQEILLSPKFREIATDDLLGPLEQFHQMADSTQALKAQIQAAFPEPEFATTFSGARPNTPADLLQYDFLILDLVLKNSAEAIEEIVTYLHKMGQSNYPDRIPPIIIMSNSPELTSERLRFSNDSQISAAGLLLLPKAKIREASFGSKGLVLSYQQLDRQRDIAHHMRVFMRTWMDALEDARSKAQTTLWNMDASAMQQIHLSAITENDPYDEHLNELMSREYLWHVESSPKVAAALEALDKCFTKQLSPGQVPPVISTRFIAPIVNAKVGRDLVSHYTWTGFEAPKQLNTISSQDALESFNKLVPFGAVLAPEILTPNSECIVHITQQCDLNASTRPANIANPTHSAQFAVVFPVEVIEHRMPSHDNENKGLVARGICIGGKEYDFKLAEGRLLALPIPRFIEYAIAEKLSVVGRLRHDIATHFLSATVNHMTRAASLKTTRIEVRNANVFLYGKNLDGGQPVMLRESDGSPAVVQYASHNKLCFFQDETSVRLALWITDKLSTAFNDRSFDCATICNTLSVGLKPNTALTNVVDLLVKGFPLNELRGQLPAERAPATKVNLVVVEVTQAKAGNAQHND